jgi:hypothetical protein
MSGTTRVGKLVWLLLKINTIILVENVNKIAFGRLLCIAVIFLIFGV